MATYTPPPYFPQGSLSPPDARRYRKFKLVIAAVIAIISLLLVGLGLAVWYLFRSAF